MKRIDFALALHDQPINKTMKWYRGNMDTWGVFPAHSEVRKFTIAPLVGVTSWLRNPA